MKATFSFLFVLLALFTVQAEAPGRPKREMPAAVNDILNKAEQFEFYSLEPEPTPEQVKGKPDLLHGYLVLGKTSIKDAKTRKSLLETIEKTRGAKGAKCFDPRHAIRATVSGKTVDLLICFECGWIYVYEGEKHTATLLVSSKAQPTFDKVLTAAKVPLAKKRNSD